MAEIVKIKKDGVTQYPITKPECVINENGKSVKDILKEISDNGGYYDDTEIQSKLTELSFEIGNNVYKLNVLPGYAEKIPIESLRGSEIMAKVTGTFQQAGYFTTDGNHHVVITRSDIFSTFFVPNDATTFFVYVPGNYEAQNIEVTILSGAAKKIDLLVQDIDNVSRKWSETKSGYFEQYGAFVEDETRVAVYIRNIDGANKLEFINSTTSDDTNKYIVFLCNGLVLSAIKHTSIGANRQIIDIPKYTDEIRLCYNGEEQFYYLLHNKEDLKDDVALIDFQLNGNGYKDCAFQYNGYINSRGKKNFDNSAFNTGFINIKGFNSIHYKVTISSGGYSIAFFNSNFQLLDDISIKGGDGTEQIIDITQPFYADANYIILSHYGQTEKFVRLFAPQGLVHNIVSRGFDGLIEIPETPLEKINESAGFARIFHNWGFIGDSFLSGNHNYYDENGQSKNEDIYEYSWGTAILKMLNCDGFLYSNGGQTAKGWINATNGRGWDKAKTEPREVYVIALGCNDAGNFVNVGTLADIDLNNYNNNADSFYGNYAGIIQRLKSIQKKAIIFVTTLPQGDRENAESYNAAIRYMATIFSNVWVIDLWQYASPVNNEWANKYRLRYHLNAMGYVYTAYEILTYIDWIIQKNPTAFRDVAFIGTNKSATSNPEVYGNNFL